MPLLILATLQQVANHFVAPFATLGTITATACAAAAFFAKSEAIEKGMDPAEEDAHIQSAINQALAAAFALAFLPVCILFAEAL
jgi:hypothetical protein